MTPELRKASPVLVVDDDRAIRRMITRILERAGTPVPRQPIPLKLGCSPSRRISLS